MSKPPIPKFTDEDYERIEKYAALGLNTTQIAAMWDRGRKFFERAAAEDERLKDAMESGRSKALTQVTQTAYQMAVSGEHPAMTMFYLKCRGRWKETHVIEHTGKDGADLRAQATEEELLARLEKLKDVAKITQG